MLTISLPWEVVLFPLLSILIYSVSLSGAPIFDDMEVLPNGEKYQWKWRYFWKSSRPLSSVVMAGLMRWPKTLRGVHAMNCWVHAVNAFLVERLAMALGVPWIQALACGLFFVAMPFAANTVAYMSGQANLLAATFGLLGSLGILSGYGLVAIPCLILAYLSKEDGLGFAATFLALGVWRREWMVVGALLGVLATAVIMQRTHLRKLLKHSGDQEMSAIGLPVSYPQPRHGLTVLFATLWRLPFWLFGLKQSPYHGSGLKR